MGGQEISHEKLINIMEEAGVDADNYVLFTIKKPL